METARVLRAFKLGCLYSTLRGHVRHEPLWEVAAKSRVHQVGLDVFFGYGNSEVG